MQTMMTPLLLRHIETRDPEAEAESVIAPEDVERVQTTTIDESLDHTPRSLDQDHTQVVAFIDQENS